MLALFESCSSFCTGCMCLYRVRTGVPSSKLPLKKLRHLRPVRAPLHLSPCSAVDESLGLEQDILYRELRASVAGRTNGTLRIYSPMTL